MFSIAQVRAAGGYSVILADPAWSYNDRRPNGGAANHYDTMIFSDIAALPVEQIASEHAALFLWGTYPLMPLVEPLMNKWGFTFKTLAFQWIKATKSGPCDKCGRAADFFGLGRWTRGNSEPCWLGVRGDITRVNAGVRQLIFSPPADLEAPVGAHSAKPPEVRDRIVTLMGDVPRIELFARTSAPGWDRWGNETESTIDLMSA